MFDFFSGSEGGFDDFLSATTPDLPDVEELLVEHLMKSGDDYGGLKMDGFHASAVATRKCPHFYAFHMLYPFEKDFTPQQIMIFKNGHSVHDRLQRIMRPVLYGSWGCPRCGSLYGMQKAYYEWLEQQRSSSEEARKEFERVKSYSDLPIKQPDECEVCGHKDLYYAEWRVISHEFGFTSKMDGVFKNKAGKFIGWEIKSANVRAFNLMQQVGPPAKYLHQFAIYLFCENRRLGDNHFESGVLTYECKNDQKRRHLPVFLSEVDITGELNAAKKALKMIRENRTVGDGKLCDECVNCDYKGNRCNPR